VDLYKVKGLRKDHPIFPPSNSAATEDLKEKESTREYQPHPKKEGASVSGFLWTKMRKEIYPYCPMKTGATMIKIHFGLSLRAGGAEQRNEYTTNRDREEVFRNRGILLEGKRGRMISGFTEKVKKMRPAF